MTDIVTQPAKTPQNRPCRDTCRSSPWLVGAVLGWWFLRDYLSFSALAENREALIAFRDANYIGTVAVFIAVYTLIVAFSLPGATIATLTGGFLFATFPGALFNITAATIGATAIFLAAQTSFGSRLAARLEGSEGVVKKIKDGIDENQWSMLFLMRLVPVVPFFSPTSSPPSSMCRPPLRDLDLLRHHAGRRGLHLRRRGPG
jgi:uncharacterized membrane protein YdjX (TVP38/TMEM64 family)